MDELRKRIVNWPTEQIKILLLFLSTEGIVNYESIAKELGINPKKTNDKVGKSIGGILSALRRNKLTGEPLILSLGRVLGLRRIQWKLNKKAIADENRSDFINSLTEILKERE